MRPYMHPASFTPPLAYGGHEWLWRDSLATCWGCGLTVPLWALVEGLWMTFGPRWCPNKIAALSRPKRRERAHDRPAAKAEMPGQLSIFDALGDQP
jgi:hypothetical protein